jgi:hypothetical protein
MQTFGVARSPDACVNGHEKLTHLGHQTLHHPRSTVQAQSRGRTPSVGTGGAPGGGDASFPDAHVRTEHGIAERLNARHAIRLGASRG